MRKFEMKNVEFNIYDMILFLIKRIKIIIVFAVVFAILVPTVKYGLDSTAYMGNNGENEQYEVVKTKLEKAQAQLENELAYVEDSYLMQLDPADLNIGTLQVYIDVEDAVSANNVSKLLKDYCGNGGLIYDICDDKDEIRKKRDVVRISYDELDSQFASSNVLISVYGNNVAICEKLIGDIKVAITNYCNSLEDANINNEVSVVKEIYYTDEDAYIKELQKNVYLKIEELQTEVDTLNSEIEYLYSAQATKPQFSVKMLVLGAIIGILLGGIMLLAYYLFSNKVKYSEELSNITELRLISELSDVKPEITALQLQAFLEVNEISKSCLLGSVSNKNLEKLDSMLEQINIVSKKLEYVQDAFANEESFDVVVKTQNVILVVENWKTNYTNIKKMISFCEMYKCEIIGYIVLS